MFEEWKNLSLNELLVKIYEVDKFYTKTEVNDIYSAIIVQINKEFDCHFNYVVGSDDDVFKNNNKKTHYNYSKNSVLINTDGYKSYVRKI